MPKAKSKIKLESKSEIKTDNSSNNKTNTTTKVTPNQIKLDELKIRTANANLPLKDTATNIVFGKGNPDAKILFIGEAPGEKEDIQGIPFVGSAGRELNKLLNSINLTIDDVYIANILKYRPPKNRDPNIIEIKSHTPFLVEQIQIIKPKVICTLGNYSTKFVLAGFNPEGMKKINGIAEIHGKPITIKIESNEFIVVPLYHPAAMLYNPKLRPVLTEDVVSIGKLLHENKK